MVAGGPIVGGCLAALPVYVIMKRLSKTFKNSVYLNAFPGNYAHLIKSDRDMIQYIEIHGRDEVRNQLIHADKTGQRLTSCAKRTYAKLVDIKPYKKVTDYLEAEQPAITASVPAKSPTTATATAQTATPAASQQTGQAQEETRIVTVLDTVVDTPGISRLMIGGQRTGKSYFAAVASREINTLIGWKIFHINLASVGDEDSYYWQHAYKSVCGDLASIRDEQVAQDLIAAAIDAIHEFISTPFSLLVLDEITFTGSKYGKWDTSGVLRLVAEQISALTSSGAKRTRAIWALCPEIIASTMKDPTKSIKSLKLVYFAVTPTMAIDWQGQKFTFDTELHTQVAANFDKVGLPTDEQISLCRRNNLPRIVHVAGEWWPLEALPEIPKPKGGYQVVTAAPSIEPSTIEDELPMLYQAVARMAVSQAQAEVDPAIELIESIADLGMREAMLISYRWARGRIDGGNPVDRAAFIERARKERNCQYLVDNRDAIWEDLQTLID